MDDAIDEYESAKKLVLRAANRESLLTKSTPNDNDDDEADDPGRDVTDILAAADFSEMPLRRDHINRPCWVCPDGQIYLEAFHDLYTSAYDFLVAIAEPVARPEFIHQYRLTPYSLYAAVATNIDTESIIRVLGRLSKNELPKEVVRFIKECTKRYGKAKLVLKFNKFFVESEHADVLRELLKNKVISQARVMEDESLAGRNIDSDGFVISAKAIEMETNLEMLREHEPSDDESDGETNVGDKQDHTTVAFQIRGAEVENVKRQAIELDYPLMEEYDFRNDKVNPDVPMDLKPNTRIRRYQERSLAKMFGNGRARSGIIVLPW